MDILKLTPEMVSELAPDFICASSPCEQFSLHGMKHFYPNPPYPELGIKLFNHTQALCEASAVLYVMENVRAAQAFIGNAKHHCGPFYLWGSGVPTLLPQGIKKGMTTASCDMTKLTPAERKAERKRHPHSLVCGWGGKDGEVRRAQAARLATIPPELSACVADYAERILIEKRRREGSAAFEYRIGGL
jgi:hypothetical protein